MERLAEQRTSRRSWKPGGREALSAKMKAAIAARARPINIDPKNNDEAVVVLTQGYVARISVADIPKIAGHSWSANICRTKSGVRVYAMGRGDKGKKSYLHRVLTDAPSGSVVDHINGDTLDNRRSNLRVTTQSLNLCNRTYNQNSNGYRGVERSGVKFVAILKINRKTIRGAPKETAFEAAQDYDALALEYHGAFARLNFPAEAVA